MEGIRGFLESSTIHGLNHISSTKKRFARLFWITVVIIGFTTAGIIINESFKAWDENQFNEPIISKKCMGFTKYLISDMHIF